MDLPSDPTGRPPTLSDLAISTPLWKLLSSQVAASAEIEEILSVPALHEEAKRLAPALNLRASPAGETRVRHALQPLVLVYGIGEAARSPAFWVSYRILANLPVEALAKGVEDYLAAPDSHYFPKPGPLKALCDKHAEPIYRAAHRATQAAKSEPALPRYLPSEEEKAAVARMLADFKARAAERTEVATKPVRPSTAGKPDEGGLTAEMRALIARRSEA